MVRISVPGILGFRVKRLVALLALGFADAGAFAQTNATWNGGTGNWSNGANWSTNPVVPNNGGGSFYSAVINGTGSDTITFDATGTVINSLSLGLGETFQDNGLSPMLTIGDPNFPAAGSLANNGTINWGNGANLALDITAGNGSIINNTPATINLTGATLAINDSGNVNIATLSGGGSISLTGGAITGRFGDETLNNVDNTIAGSGSIGGLTLVNNGVISANGTSAFTVMPNSGGFTNNGVVSATGAGGLIINGLGPLTNNGTMTVDGSSLMVNGNLSQGSLGQLTLDNRGTGTITGSLTGAGVVVHNNSTLSVQGNLVSGGVFLQSFSSLSVGGNLSVSELGSTIGNITSVTGVFSSSGSSFIDGGLGAASIINSGSLDVTGVLSSVSSAGDFSNSGSLSIDPTNSADVRGNFNNTGSVNVVGGTNPGHFGGIFVGGNFNNIGIVTMMDGRGGVTVEGLFGNSGSVTVLSPETMNANGGFSNLGGVTIGFRGTLNVTGGYTQNGVGSSTDVAGALNTDSYEQAGGATTIETGGLVSSITFKATGGVVTVNGTLDPTAVEFGAGATLQGTGAINGNVAMGGTRGRSS